MTDHDLLRVQTSHQGAFDSRDRLRRAIAAELILIGRDIALFFRPARHPLAVRLIMAMALFVAIGLVAVMFECAADIVVAHGMPGEFAIALRYLSQLIVWLDVAAVGLLFVSTLRHQMRELLRMFGA